MVVRDEYQTSNVSVLTSEEFEGHTQNSGTAGIGGVMRWTAIKPNKGQRVNNKGMDLVYKATGLPAQTYTLRVFLELVKIATIENGEFSCYFA
jgi:predicted secreted protein